MNLMVIILTFNEERHISRCIQSARAVTDRVVVVDSFSTDSTCEIAQTCGAVVMQNQWSTHAGQFNWALENIDSPAEWILRIDADEYLTPELIAEINAKLPNIPAQVAGICLNRRMTFMGRLIKHGGVFPVKVLRLFRFGKGVCEDRLVDEHIMVDGEIGQFDAEVIDDNLQSLEWWISKHNKYSNFEAAELLNLKYGFLKKQQIGNIAPNEGVSQRRWLKEHIYVYLPISVRSWLYFTYRYVVRFGFLDGTEGFLFNFLQGYWYRLLVDAKAIQVEKYMKEHGKSVRESVVAVLGIPEFSLDNSVN